MSAHVDLEHFRGWLLKHRKEDFEYVNIMKRVIFKPTIGELEELVKKLGD